MTAQDPIMATDPNDAVKQATDKVTDLLSAPLAPPATWPRTPASTSPMQSMISVTTTPSLASGRSTQSSSAINPH